MLKPDELCNLFLAWAKEQDSGNMSVVFACAVHNDEKGRTEVSTCVGTPDYESRDLDACVMRLVSRIEANREVTCVQEEHSVTEMKF